MSTESYTAAMRPRINEIMARTERAISAGNIVGRLVEKYAYFNNERDHAPLQTPEIEWDNDSPGDIVWMTLYDGHGRSIEEAAGKSLQRSHQLVERAEFIFGPFDTIFGTVFSVNLNLPSVVGLEGKQLEAPEIERVIVDLIHYENALGSRTQQ